jgi:hypothetical protein
MPGFSFFVTLAAGVVAWFARRIPGAVLSVVVAAALVMAVIGVVVAADMATWGSLTAAAFAVSGGVLLGRALRPSSGPMVALLVVASIVDIAWVVSGGAGPEGFREVANISLRIGENSSSIGTLDVLLAAAIATHWQARSASPATAILAAPLGMIAANVFVAISGVTNLPLVPFIGFGWLLSEAWVRRSVLRSTVTRRG